MRALLLAAGLGTRLRPVTDHLPKCLVPIHGVPLLDLWIHRLAEGGCDQILINTHYMSDLVKEHVLSYQQPVAVELVHEADLLGTGGTLLKNREFFSGDDTIMLVHADNLSAFDVPAFIRRFAERPPRSCLTMMTFATDAPSTCGIVEIDQEGCVVAFHEKKANPPSNLANAAVYLASPEIFPLLSDVGRPFVDFSNDVIPQLLGRMNTFHNEVYHRDIGNLQSFGIAQRDWLFTPRHAMPSIAPVLQRHGFTIEQLGTALAKTQDAIHIDGFTSLMQLSKNVPPNQQLVFTAERPSTEFFAAYEALCSQREMHSNLQSMSSRDFAIFLSLSSHSEIERLNSNLSLSWFAFQGSPR